MALTAWRLALMKDQCWPLLGRDAERAVLTALLDRAAAGRGGAMVLRGEPGIGKTALLEAVSGLAARRGMTTAGLAGIEAEAPLGYAALHQLLRSFPGAVARLPRPQRDALRSALGLAGGPPPDPFLAGAGLLMLLAGRAAPAPLVVMIDDAQWLDPQSRAVLGLAARSLRAEQVVMLFASRQAADRPELLIGRLPDQAAAGLLAEVTGGPLSPRTRAGLLRSGQGNPRALIELARQLTPEQVAGTAVLPDPVPVPGSLRQTLAGRLTPGQQMLLALAAAEPDASERLMRDAARRLGIDAGQPGPDHPLAHSAAYYDLPLPGRQRIHRALAQAMTAPRDADRAAWHLAMAATGPDEPAASRLEQAARRACRRDGYPSAVTLLRRAAGLSADAYHRTERLLAAAEAALIAGPPGPALVLLGQARQEPADERQAAIARRLSGAALAATGPTSDAARMLLDAARALLPVDAPLARRTLLSALTAGGIPAEVRTAAGVLSAPHGMADRFLLGFLHRLNGDAEPAARQLRTALGALERSGPAGELPPAVPVLAAVELLDDAALHAAASSYASFASQAGALAFRPAALLALAGARVRQGRFGEAEATLAEVRRLTAVPEDALAGQQALLASWRGRDAGAHPHPAALLDLARGQYRDAFERLQPVVAQDQLGPGTLVLPDFIEAAARSGQPGPAAAALGRLAARATASGAPTALGRLARSGALLAGDSAAEPLYRESIELLSDANLATELARGHLLLGEWLRRQRRRKDARSELQAARDMFAGLGAVAFADRARSELAATGEQVRRRVVETATALTAQETQVARLVAGGATNRETAGQLFLSPATVDYHLRKVYQKLGISSRTHLARHLADAGHGP